MNKTPADQLNLERRKWLMMHYSTLAQHVGAMQTLCVMLASEECAKPQPNEKTLNSLATIEETLRKAQHSIVQHVFKVGCKM